MEEEIGTPGPYQPLQVGATQVFVVTQRSDLSWFDIWDYQQEQQTASGVMAPGFMCPGLGKGVIRQLSLLGLGSGITLYGKGIGTNLK